MKKKLLVAAIVIASLTFSGCASSGEYEDLEKRVSYLETQLGIQYDESTSDDSEAGNVVSDINGATTDESFTYIIDSLTDEEVVAECQYYFSNIPAQGESYEDYFAKFKAQPVSTSQDSGVVCLFYRDSAQEPTEHDVITWIDITGIQTEMDGPIGYGSDFYVVRVNMLIQDYSRASNIYDQLYNILSEKYTDVNDDRTSTQWAASGYFQTTHVGADVNFLSMEKLENGYALSTSYYSLIE